MIETGVLTPQDRVELIDGEVLAMTPQGSAHAACVSLAHEAVRRAFEGVGHVRAQLPLALGTMSEPEPDVAVVIGTPRDYRGAHPQSALLVVEVADSTLDYDRGVKAGLYAAAGVPEYWTVNLIDQVVEVFRDPVSDERARFGSSYRVHSRLSARDSIVPVSAVQKQVAVADLMA